MVMKRSSTRKKRSMSAKARRSVVSVNAGTRQLRQARKLAVASGETILRRTARMGRAMQTGEGLRDPEFARMGSEKVTALLDSWRAMGLRLPAMNRLMAQHWSSQMQKLMSSAFAMAACRSPAAAATVGYNTGTSMLGDAVSLNLALIRFGQGLSQAAGAPVLRMAAGNARRLASGDNSQRI
jgi:hypothetical protein